MCKYSRATAANVEQLLGCSIVPHDVRDLRSLAKRVYDYLVRHGINAMKMPKYLHMKILHDVARLSDNERGMCYASSEYLASECGVTVKHLNASIREIPAVIEIVRIFPRTGPILGYRLNWESMLSLPPSEGEASSASYEIPKPKSFSAPTFKARSAAVSATRSAAVSEAHIRNNLETNSPIHPNTSHQDLDPEAPTRQKRERNAPEFTPEYKPIESEQVRPIGIVSDPESIQAPPKPRTKPAAPTRPRNPGIRRHPAPSTNPPERPKTMAEAIADGPWFGEGGQLKPGFVDFGAEKFMSMNSIPPTDTAQRIGFRARFLSALVNSPAKVEVYWHEYLEMARYRGDIYRRSLASGADQDFDYEQKWGARCIELGLVKPEEPQKVASNSDSFEKIITEAGARSGADKRIVDDIKRRINNLRQCQAIVKA